MPRVYVSLPLRGPSGSAGRDVLRGAELAAASAEVELVVLDAYDQDDRDELAAGHARRAAADADALAYLGDFHSSQVWATAPVLSAAGLLQIAPVATFTGLGSATLVRLMPNDAVLARAIADWLDSGGVRSLLVVHDHDDGYGVPVGRMCTDAARDRGIDVRSRPIWDHDESTAGDVDGSAAVLYVGVAGSGVVGLWHDLHALDPELWLLATDGVAVPWLAEELDPGAAARTRLFGAQRAPWGFYGYEAMALALDAIAVGGGDREQTVLAARSTRDRDSVLGRYSIDADGLTTATECGRFAVVDGEIVWDRLLAAP